MVSTRPSPAPAKGRMAYPSASNYTPGDVDNSPSFLGSTSPPTDADRERAQGLKLWWKAFRDQGPAEGPRVFGVPLSESIKYASVQISTAAEDGSLYVWGVIPVVVAKCGLYLKENGTEVEGAFRISGSTKRMRDLQAVFDSGPKYGKNINWKVLPYTTHDVATIFRRFLTQMPEPIIPFEFYDQFREGLDAEAVQETIDRYKELIRALPPVNQYLLLYVLDLLHVFANNSEQNLMTAPNLALIFQPGVLSHPVHVMRPRDHVLSQQVLEFLIENQDHFLIGMQLPKRDTKSPSILSSRSSTPPPSVRMVKADPDFMLPSDSDDEAPAGGYYVVESSGRKPVSATQPEYSAPKIEPSLIPSKPAPVAYTSNDIMDPSDSDDDAPPGGYEVRIGDPARARAAFLTRTAVAGKSRAAAPSPTPSSIARRRTLPAGHSSGWKARRKDQAVKEAPA
ncbi:Rho GTPase activation protein [Kockovaella imperatae]|uniref:Rho GTPase activation protein n=1 Tax=Kockovaella imperatae TaxID=4999 RepID=A0A1Y1UK79_9TREE|nr:Rho GTPase activation protein [Kockovaella imperatae]ORX38458.1 Rho GTPase activation protein [Kockovaella imperatae]